jgi:TolB-like protein
MHTIKTICFLLIAGWASVFSAASAQTNDIARLAIVAETSDTAPVAEMLTVELSHYKSLQLLERDEVEKIYREQALSADNQDYLKLGRMLGADGLLLLAASQSGTNQFLNLRLIAVKPGVVLVAEKFPSPIRNLTAWSVTFASRLNYFVPKLAVLAKNAIPISIVNLRSAVASRDGMETEQQLKLLTIQRLSQEPQIFVLERETMPALAEEKDFNLDDSAFWDGSYLLDGTVDQNGYDKNTITINARLTPPKGGAPLLIGASGSRTNLAEVINHLATKVDETLNVNSINKEWNAADEARQFYNEAKWALKWGVYVEAQRAAESAWALGKRDAGTGSLLVRACAESIPEFGMNLNEIRVLQIPDASEFAPLNHGLDFFLQNAPVLFSGTNSSQAFSLGLHLLYESAGLLEGYYYAAELRASQADALLALREKTRETFDLLNTKLLLATNTSNRIPPWDDPRRLFAKLEWNEAGVAFEHPENAFGFYQGLLNGGAHPEHLPRFIGWNWPDRRRVPALLRRFADQAGASTNAMVHLEGLYFNLLLAPDDEQGSLRRSEEELESAMWENRGVLFNSPENASLVERTRQALCVKEDYSDIYHAFSHEPFASFKHKLRMDFLAHGNATNLAVLEELFPNTSEKMETPEQARELLPAMEKFQQRLSNSKLIDFKLASLRRSAGIAQTNNHTAPAPSVSTAKLVEANFIPWNLRRPGIDAGRQPAFYGMKLRSGLLWLRVRYAYPNDEVSMDYQTTYLAVDPQRGVREEIFFPEKLCTPGDLFEVSDNALFVEADGHLYQFKFNARRWEKIPAPMEGSSGLAWLKDRLYVGRGDGLLAVNPESQKNQLLVGARRTPAVNAVDPLWTADTQIYSQANGRIGVLAGHYDFQFTPDSERWIIRPFPRGATNGYSMAGNYISAGGALRLLTGPYARRYLVGFGNDDGPANVLLMEETGIPTSPPPGEKWLQPVRWDWPKGYPMEHSQITTDGTNLWVLTPRLIFPGFAPQEPVKFADNRQETLFCFTPDFRQPLSAAIHLPDDKLGEMPKVNGRSVNFLNPLMFNRMNIWTRQARHVGNTAFWLRTRGGLVFGGPNYCGHWFISDQMLAPSFQAQRVLLGHSSISPAPAPASPHKL